MGRPIVVDTCSLVHAKALAALSDPLLDWLAEKDLKSSPWKPTDWRGSLRETSRDRAHLDALLTWIQSAA